MGSHPTGYGARYSEKPKKVKPQRYCECGGKILSPNRKWCLDCEAELIRKRRNARQAVLAAERRGDV